MDATEESLHSTEAEGAPSPSFPLFLLLSGSVTRAGPLSVTLVLGGRVAC